MMADTKISGLPASGGGTDAMLMPVVQGGANAQLTGTQLLAYLQTRATIPSYTWAGLPSAAGNPGLIVLVTDVGVSGGSLWQSTSSLWMPLSNQIMLYRSRATGTALTGTTTETALATVAVPAGLLGTNRGLFVDATATITGNTNSKTVGARFGASATSGFKFANLGTSTASIVALRTMGQFNNNASASIQRGNPTVLNGAGGGTSSGIAAGAIDSSLAQNCVITGILGNSADSITSELIEVWLVA